MTATPRIYDDSSKSQAQDNDAELCSMDNEELYGTELHHLGFGEAVSMGLLIDYKVLVLAVAEDHISKAFQSQLADQDSELNLDDAAKIVGCWHGLSKKGLSPSAGRRGTGERDSGAEQLLWQRAPACRRHRQCRRQTAHHRRALREVLQHRLPAHS